MRLASIRVYNFKSIQDTGSVKFSNVDNITIIAGQNESGKSSVLEALDFFENGASDDFEEYYRRVDTYPRVECNYSLSKDELDAIESSSKSKALRAYLEENGFSIVRGSTEKDDLESHKYLTNEELKQILKDIETAESDAETVDGEDAAEAFEYFATLDGMRPKFILYGSFEESLLPNKITKAKLSENEAVADFEKVFDIDFDDLLSATTTDTQRKNRLSTVNNNASDDLNTYWSQKIGDEESTYNFELEAHYQAAQPEQSYINFYIDQGDGSLHISQKSKGFQWFSSFNLRLRAHEVSAEDLNDFILLIDEPGQGLHEEAQKDVRKVLEEITGKDIQILYSTHQPQLLGGSEVEFSRLRLTIKDKVNGTLVRNVSQATSQNGFKDALSPVRTALGQITLSVESFTSGQPHLIVEGITEYYYLKAWKKLLGKDDSFILIPATGVTQVPNVYSILYGWGVSAKILVDDEGQGTKAYNKVKGGFFQSSTDEEVEKYLLKNSDCKGIEDTFTKNDFLKFTDGLLAGNDNAINSDRAKGNKDIIGRTFLDKVGLGEINLENLDKTTTDNFKKIVKFAEKK